MPTKPKTRARKRIPRGKGGKAADSPAATQATKSDTPKRRPGRPSKNPDAERTPSGKIKVQEGQEKIVGGRKYRLENSRWQRVRPANEPTYIKGSYRMQVRLPEDWRFAVETAADVRGVSVSTFVRDAIRSALPADISASLGEVIPGARPPEERDRTDSDVDETGN